MHVPFKKEKENLPTHSLMSSSNYYHLGAAILDFLQQF
jgi:hypothetical protein